MRNIKVYLTDILDEIDKAKLFIKGINFKQFEKDDKTQYAVIRCLEIIGEASKKIPNTIKQKYSDVPWKEISCMRNKLIHEYFGINILMVWKTIKKDLPPLKKIILQIIKEES
ncbi:HepT-like ribonuclease domain-containing protein [Stygiobacter electus]|uniref:DUF86 domain-containing protein n=1 Tax=Stygiobacter electus TaxID=3032292 RepID=A0AAE3TCN3_9BACT|nr:DUF86 domain-containing protein [Stygiobacter electus]MDF1611611.1 DUF86 domain-containing protein [Stygiobacter electus]